MTGELLSLPRTYMTFRLGGQAFGFESELLWEATAHYTLSGAPRPIPFLVAVTQLHGKILPVLDLAGLLGIRRGSDLGGLLAVYLPGQPEPLACFCVDQVLGFTKIPAADLRLPDRKLLGKAIPFLAGWAGEGDRLPLLDLAGILRSLLPETPGAATMEI